MVQRPSDRGYDAIDPKSHELQGGGGGLIASEPALKAYR